MTALQVGSILKTPSESGIFCYENCTDVQQTLANKDSESPDSSVSSLSGRTGRLETGKNRDREIQTDIGQHFLQNFGQKRVKDRTQTVLSADV